MARRSAKERRDGSPFPQEISLNATDRGLVCIDRDISERKQLQEQLLQAQKMEAVGQLAGGVAHDFNNLLSAILGYAHLVTMTPSNGDEINGFAREIQSAALRAADLTRQLLAFSRRQVVEPTVVDLNDLIRNVNHLLRRLIGEDIEVVTLLAQNLGRVRADAAHIEQVVINLAVNARDAMPDGGRLVIESANATLDKSFARGHPQVVAGEYVMVSVSDNGTGMAEEVRERAFEPFFTTKEIGKGTGLGLSVCYGIVAQSEGLITVDSEPGRGATFKIYLPRVEGPLGPPSGDALSALAPGTETVLLVEDEPAVRGMVSRVLREQGYTILEASNGQEALALAVKTKSRKIDLLLTDVVMPLMGGAELARRLGESRPGTKVLFTSGYADGISNQEVSQPDTEFMHKPFTPSVLTRTVRDLLDASHTHSAA